MNNTGSTGEIISLPEGGGALKGIGETFSPDLFSGTGNFSIPITLPPGRNGFQPELSIGYSSGNGNGPFGLGWALNIPGVTRKTARGIPQYRDQSNHDHERDTFLLSGAEDLVPISREQTLTIYQPRTEGLFAKITHYHDVNNNYWEVRSKDGLVSYYGKPALAENDPTVCTNPNRLVNIFAWRLSQTRDTFGNVIEYEYERDSGSSERPWDQLYIKQIRYADYTEDEQTHFLVTVNFHYEERPDPFSDYRAGFEIRTTRRCTHITVHTHAGVDRLVRTFRFQYLDQSTRDPDLLPLNNVSLLHQVTVEGHDDAQTESLPPLTFAYTHFDIEQRTFKPVQGHLPAQSLADASLAFVDLFGNGLPDILQMSDTTRYWRNLGDGRFDLPRTMTSAPAGVVLGERGVRLLDANGDGRTDLLVHRDNISGYYPLAFGGLWNRKSFRRYEQAPSFEFDDAEVALVDINGDGITDMVRSGSRFEYYFNDPDEGWNHTRRVEREVLEAFPNVNFSDPRIRWADMSGDGLSDIVLIHDGNIEYWPNLGHGNWGKRISMRHAPRFPYGYDLSRLLLGDIDGDGVADMVYVDHGKITFWINRGGNEWSDPVEIDGTPPVADNQSVSLADIYGTGVTGILWSQDQSGPARHPMHFLDFTGGVKPYLLHEMNNNMGAITRVAYGRSINHYLRDEQHPQTRWQTPLPFPVLVVDRVEVIDQVSASKLTTEYSYHHGYWDGEEREFRGFARVDQRDTESFDQYHDQGLHADQPFNPVEQLHFSPPTETRSWFHQGAISDDYGDWYEADYRLEYWQGDENQLQRPESVNNLLSGLTPKHRRDALRTLRGQLLRSELYALDGTERQDRPYTVTESIAGVREESPPSQNQPKRQRIFFPYAIATRTTQWERGNDPMSQFSFTDDYDEYGQARKQSQIACPRGWRYLHDRPGEAFLATVAFSEYAVCNDNALYIVDRIAKATACEILNDGTEPIAVLINLPPNSERLRTISQSINYYDGEAFTGLPFGQVGAYGAISRSEALALTGEILENAWRSGDEVTTPAERPPYLQPGDNIAWTDEYPAEFRQSLQARAGYQYYDGSDEHASGYFVAAKQKYDFQDDNIANPKGLPLASRDPFDNETTINYDHYSLFPIQVTDPIGLTINAQMDYRVMQPWQVTDANGNRTRVSFSPLGLVTATAIMGKASESLGDTLEVPGSRLEYDFFAFANNQQPVYVRTIARMHHVHDMDVPQPERDRTITTIEYTDGFGRLLQTRTQGENTRFGDPRFGNQLLPIDQTVPVPAATGVQNHSPDNPNVIVSGWQRYNNKGKVVEQYEPFYDTGWQYQPVEDSQLGQKVVNFYDPRGQVIRTLNPDQSEQRVIFGVPGSITAPILEDPEHYEPTPWESYTYDVNDNAGRTHGSGDQRHWNTPASARIDALGRVIETIERNGHDPSMDWYVTATTYNIQGNPLTITDALGRLAFQYVYDLAGNTLRIDSIDAGVRRVIFDARGSEIERRDSKGALLLQSYDPLNRQTHLWARDGTGQTMTLRERLIYADQTESGMTWEQAKTVNMLGQLYHYYDEAGLISIEAVDFKGNPLEKIRKVISDESILSVFNNPPPDWNIDAFRVDWQPPDGMTLEQHAASLLDNTEFRSSTRYDALNRPKLLIYPQDVDGQRKILTPVYNNAGALKQIRFDGDTYVKHIAYNAKGQRTLIAYGNNVMTRYAYDQQTFRLERVRSERYTQPGDLIYQPSGQALQDFSYDYDLAGNITAIHDRTPDCGILDTTLGRDALDRQFVYDAIYRLLSATGRECDRPSEQPWDDSPRCTDLTRVRPYTETYDYDAMGNCLELKHANNGNGGFVRHFAHYDENNRLNTMEVNSTNYQYQYDTNGNMIRETSSRHFDWDHSDHMKSFRTQSQGSEPSVYSHYLYDAGGERIKKLVHKQQGVYEVTTYIDGVFEYQKSVKPNTIVENNTLHIMDDDSRLATIRIGQPFPDDTTPALKYILGDHLGNSNLVIDTNASWVNREEFTPYGETSFGSYKWKRYRYTGKERDEESGYQYFGVRYYSSILLMWVACDPATYIDGLNLYKYVRGSPINFIDSNGFRSKFISSNNSKQKVSNGTFKEGKKTRERIDNTNSTSQIENILQSSINLITEEGRLFERDLKLYLIGLGGHWFEDQVSQSHPLTREVVDNITLVVPVSDEVKIDYFQYTLTNANFNERSQTVLEELFSEYFGGGELSAGPLKGGVKAGKKVSAKEESKHANRLSESFSKSFTIYRISRKVIRMNFFKVYEGIIFYEPSDNDPLPYARIPTSVYFELSNIESDIQYGYLLVDKLNEKQFWNVYRNGLQKKRSSERLIKGFLRKQKQQWEKMVGSW